MHFSKTIGLAFATIASSAFAADLPSRRVAPAYVAPAPMFTWAGFYVGVNLGGTFGGNTSATLSSGSYAVNPSGGLVAAAPATGTAIARSGVRQIGGQSAFLGGGQIGWNFQFSPSVVAGLEADIQGTVGSNSAVASAASGPVSGLFNFVPGFATLDTVTLSKRLDYFGTVRGRLGWLVTPSVLLYGTGGLAYGGAKSTATIFGAPIASPIPFGASAGSFTASGTRLGWTVGAGAEWMFASNWSAKIEYLYYDLGSRSYSVTTMTPAANSIAFLNTTSVSTRFNGHIVRAGLNYHFNWGSAPVVAKY